MDEVRDSYDAMAERYAAVFLDDLDRDDDGRRWLATFAEWASARNGVVADLGCGPGHVVDHLHGLGLAAVGYDLSPGQIREARRAFPDAQFHVGDLAALDIADASLGGIVARYSLIHMPPTRFGDVFAEWIRVLEPGAPVLLSFFAASAAEAHGAPFDHAVVTAYELFPEAIVGQMQDAGFTGIEFEISDPPEGTRPIDHATVLARKRGS